MRAWHIGNFNDLKLEEGTISPAEGEVKVKISKVALSATDVACFAQKEMDKVTVPAHSAIAFITSDDEEHGFKLGARVVVNPYVSVNEHGVSLVKTMGVDMDGLMRDFVSVPVENVFNIPDGIPDEDALFTDYIAMGNKVFSSLNYEEGDYIAVVGAGTLGLTICQLAMYYQMVPVLIDLDAEKLNLARKYGVYYTLNPTFDSLERRVEEITGGRMCESAVFTAEGVGLNAALRLVKNGSEVIMAGHSAFNAHQVDMNIIMKKQLVVKGVYNGAGEMPSAINLLANKIVRTDGIITVRESFDNLPKIYDECIKYPFKYNTVMFTID
ncbi:MAG: zinc-binding dehydrogenase [Clostridia bacterium]|nr:zinc-binding dehydrogenase [Clostridia bacterium]